MTLTKNQIIIAGIAGVLVLGFILVLLGVLPGLKSSNPDPKLSEAVLDMWTVGDTGRAYETVVSNFKTEYPNTEIIIRTFSGQADYEKTLINALAIGEGPDIFAVPNSALGRDLAKLAPMPADLPAGGLPLTQFNRLFPQIVGQNFISQNKIYALPLAIDTLAMHYNRDLFNAAGLPLPPATWEDLRDLVPQLTKFDANRNIVQSGVAIGGSGQTIYRAGDLLMLMMLQKDAPFTAGGNSAFDFYISFANAGNNHYSWNESLGSDRQKFAAGQIAIIFDYAEARPLIADANPNLNFGTAAIPQFANQAKPAALARYWGLGVSKQSPEIARAWEFIIHAATNEESANAYLVSVQKPPALNSLISRLNNDPNWEIFAKQALIAKSWPQYDPLALGQIFSRAISNVLTGRLNAAQAMQQAKTEYEAL